MATLIHFPSFKDIGRSVHSKSQQTFIKSAQEKRALDGDPAISKQSATSQKTIIEIVDSEEEESPSQESTDDEGNKYHIANSDTPDSLSSRRYGKSLFSGSPSPLAPKASSGVNSTKKRTDALKEFVPTEPVPSPDTGPSTRRQRTLGGYERISGDTEDAGVLNELVTTEPVLNPDPRLSSLQQAVLDGPGMMLKETEGAGVQGELALKQPIPNRDSRPKTRPQRPSDGPGRMLEGTEAGVVLVDPTPENPQNEANNVAYSHIEQLQRHPTLTSYGLVVNKRYHLLICHHCDQAITPHAVKHHLNQSIGLGVSASVIADIQQVATSLGVPFEQYPTIDMSNGPITAIAGLKVQSKHGCPRCIYTASLPNVLNEGPANSNLRILPLPAPESTFTLQEALVQQFEEFNPFYDDVPTSPEDSRLISPWILRTRFHKLSEGRDTSKCRALVSLPTEQEHHLQGLGKAVTRYFDECSALLNQTDPFVLQLLNSSELDTDGINHTPLHEHHQAETTNAAYSLPITHLVASVTRQGFDDFTLPTSDEVKRAVELL
ncbi:hypothetical protein EST38_g13452, partial [Candolleomyces aberdarensis]